MLHAAVPQRHPKDEGLCTSPVSSASHTRDLTHRVQQSVVEALSSWSLAVRKRGASQQNVTEASHLTTRDRATSSPKILGKRPQRKESYTPSDDEGDESSLKRAKTTFIGDSRNGRKFACPYFKRDPEKYISRRSCVGPGWEEVRRVKEHLYRNHALPHFCPRCYETFKVESLLHDHQRGAEPCAIQPKGLVDGFDKLQEKRLRSRKKTCPNQNEADKWRDMYRILFPDDEDTSIPSPYWKAIYQRGRPAVTDELARYEQFLRRELPSAVRRELESAVEREFSPVEERLKTQLIDIARDLQLRLFQTYTQSRTAEAPSDRHALDSPRATNPAELATTVSAGELHGASELPSVETEPASLEPLPPVGFSSAYEFDAVLFQFDELQDLGAFEDSSYGSMFADDAFAKDSLDDFSDDFYNGGYDNGEGPSGTC
ncbi:hypothetical protein K458DRAFT_464501 [Lentithecium fluviatile CBS 122367]|uniref:C2H2-type domain-containing protein n=1 Tax=Lentithecium fluviatile CBS 122367 TaxID=1168545 RepID=A0A6G1II11_9PLEO|nr:hypothetical protein K458DRAFT_464501 [Lentithecium fluviatile CBS 122367]